MNQQQYQALQEELSYYKKQINLLKLEKSNLQLMINCILASHAKQITAKQVINKESRSSTVQQNFAQSRCNTQSDVVYEPKSPKQGQDFFEIDLLHQTCHLMQEQSKSSQIQKIFSRHFINNKTLYLMIKSKNYQHALLKMVSFTNDLIDIVIHYRDELTQLNRELQTNRSLVSKPESDRTTDFKMLSKRIQTYQSDNNLLNRKSLNSTSNSPSIKTILENFKKLQDQRKSTISQMKRK